jgi:hypothetical protein
MGTTFGELKTRLSTVLQDPSQKTFTEGLVEELIFAGLTEVGFLSPEQFTEDIDPVADQLTYALRSADFAAGAPPEIELSRVEIWDPTQSPERRIATVPNAGLEYSSSDSGWSVWGGQLTLPVPTVIGLQGHESDYVIRVWGYSPFVQPTSGDDAAVLGLSKDQEAALLMYAQIEGITFLLNNRNLFTQWQTRTGNTDMSPAALMNERNILRQAWREKSRLITRLRAKV